MSNRTQAITFYNQGVALLPTDAATAYRLFASSVYVDQGFAQGWYAVGNALSDQGLLNAAVAAWRRAVEADPTDVKSWCNLGHRLYGIGQIKEARHATLKAIEIDPNASHAWANLSMIHTSQGEHRDAVRAAQKAFDIENTPTTEMALAFALLHSGDWARGLKHFESRYAYRFKQFESYPYPKWRGEAEKAASGYGGSPDTSDGSAPGNDAATDAVPNPTAPSFNGRTPDFESGDVGSIPAGAAKPENDRQQSNSDAPPAPARCPGAGEPSPCPPDAVQGSPPSPSQIEATGGVTTFHPTDGSSATGSLRALPVPPSDGRPLTLLITAEQGIGDTLSFARFIPRVIDRLGIHFDDFGKPHGGRLIIQVQKELVPLFRAMFEQAGNPDEKDAGLVGIVPTPTPYIDADFWITPTSLPVALGLTNREFEDAQFPHIDIINRFTCQPIWKIPGRKLHIGVAWAGSPHNDIDKWRSFDVKHLLDIAKVPGVQLYGLQVGDRAQDSHNAGMATVVHDLQNNITDVTSTVGILKHLDLVITCESFLAHLAGTMGVETWLAYSHLGRDYRLAQNGDKPLWYNRHRVFKQGPDLDWRPVFEKIRRAVEEKMQRLEKVAAE